MDREVLADFLQQVRHAKQLEASNIRRQMAMLDTDIGSVGAFLNHQPRPASADLSAPRSCPLPTPASGVSLAQSSVAGLGWLNCEKPRTVPLHHPSPHLHPPKTVHASSSHFRVLLVLSKLQASSNAVSAALSPASASSLFRCILLYKEP